MNTFLLVVGYFAIGYIWALIAVPLKDDDRYVESVVASFLVWPLGVLLFAYRGVRRMLK